MSTARVDEIVDSIVNLVESADKSVTLAFIAAEVDGFAELDPDEIMQRAASETAGQDWQRRGPSEPFTWKAKPDDIIAARKRGFQMLESIH